MAEPKDIIRKPDIARMFKELAEVMEKGEPLVYEWEDKKGKNHQTKLWVEYYGVACLIAILFLFGKRISEVVTLKRKDIWEKRNHIYVRFRVLKKKQPKEKLGEPIYKVKRIHKEKSWTLSKFIVKHANSIPHPEAYLFPGNSRPHVQVVRNKKTGKVYKYNHESSGHMSRITAYKILKALDPNYYPHYFRKSLATKLAEEHFDAIELKQWFDWTRYDTAMRYIQESGVITEGISNRQI